MGLDATGGVGDYKVRLIRIRLTLLEAACSPLHVLAAAEHAAATTAAAEAWGRQRSSLPTAAAGPVYRAKLVLEKHLMPSKQPVLSSKTTL